VKQLYIANVNNSLYLGSGLYLSNIPASFDEKERNELVAYVNEALQFAKENGKQKSLAVFNDPNGNFTRDGRYIFAYDYEGRSLALPYQPELIGTNRIDAQDPNGVYFIQQAIDAAKIGECFPLLYLSRLIKKHDAGTKAQLRGERRWYLVPGFWDLRKRRGGKLIHLASIGSCLSIWL
jgi:hypothetical protein